MAPKRKEAPNTLSKPLSSPSKKLKKSEESDSDEDNGVVIKKTQGKTDSAFSAI